MSYEQSEIDPAIPDARSCLSRRGLLRGTAGLGIAGVAAGVLAGATAGTASASTASAVQAGASAQTPSGGPLVAHVYDARTGEVDVFTGQRHVRVHDPALARALAHAMAVGH